MLSSVIKSKNRHLEFVVILKRLVSQCQMTMLLQFFIYLYISIFWSDFTTFTLFTLMYFQLRDVLKNLQPTNQPTNQEMKDLTSASVSFILVSRPLGKLGLESHFTTCLRVLWLLSHTAKANQPGETGGLLRPSMRMYPEYRRLRLPIKQQTWSKTSLAL